MKLLNITHEFFNNCPQAQTFFNDHIELITKAKGSNKNHQAWEGGYLEHIEQCFLIAFDMYESLEWIAADGSATLPFSLTSVFKVVFFHDIEKIWKYSVGLPIDFDKNEWYNTILPVRYDLKFTSEELNALKYIHGENENYDGNNRVMNELAAFCHAVDTISARIFHSLILRDT